jgi:hypothetical protein
VYNQRQESVFLPTQAQHKMTSNHTKCIGKLTEWARVALEEKGNMVYRKRKGSDMAKTAAAQAASTIQVVTTQAYKKAKTARGSKPIEALLVSSSANLLFWDSRHSRHHLADTRLHRHSRATTHLSTPHTVHSCTVAYRLSTKQ